MEFTEFQKKAIDTKDCSLLVAAGAGSGKTGVLTTRIIDRILDPKNDTDITKFLIATFTRAAAEEMSERIRRKLTEISVSQPNNKKLIKNISLLPQANISTISSFCYDLVKENYQRLGLSPAIRIAEENEIDVITNRILENITEERLTNPDEYPLFSTVYDLFIAGKSDQNFSSSIVDFYKRLINLPCIDDFLNKVCADYLEVANSSEFFDTFLGKKIKDYALSQLNDAKELLTTSLDRFDDCDSPDLKVKFSDQIETDILAIDNIISSFAGGYDAVFYQICEFAPKNKPINRDEYTKEFTDFAWLPADTARSIVKSQLKKELFTVSSDVIKKCAFDYYNLSKEISEIISLLDHRINEEKKNRSILSFSDVERYALDLLYDDVQNEKVSEFAKSLSQRFKEIYIDEYQDINPVQDLIFKALALKNSDNEEYNRFMVGDSKQSIYGFRGARPEIFNNYRRTFDDVDDISKAKRKIFMQNNFRCAESIISFSNMLFEQIMPDDYDSCDKLIFSKISKNPINSPVKFIFCDTASSNISAEKCKLIEAKRVFEEITGIVNNPNILNSDGAMYSLKDITILTRTWNDAEILEDFFTKKQIPVICERGESFFGRDEIKLALNIIRSVDNPEKNICTAGFMRSAICGFTDDDLAIIRNRHKKASLFSATRLYLDSEDADEAIAKKIDKFLALHKQLRSLSRNNNAHDFINKMYKATDIINICAGSPANALEKDAAKIRKKNLSTLYTLAKNFDKTVFKGISSFLEYVDNLRSNKNSLKSASIATEGIHVMTIHQSKGLEFPICFLYNANNDGSKRATGIPVNESIGFTFKLKSLEKIASINGTNGFTTVKTPFYHIIDYQNDENEKNELKRLLYVAVTRAKDRLYITASPKITKDFHTNISANREYKLKNAKNPMEYILAFLFSKNENLSLKANDGKRLTYHFPDETTGKIALELEVSPYFEDHNNDESEVINAIDVTEEYTPPSTELLERIKQRMASSSSALSKIASIPPKLTVSLLKHGLIDYEDAENASIAQRNPLTMPEFIRETALKTGAEIGTAMHTFLQFANYESCENNGCEAEADRLLADSFITQKQRDMLNLQKLNDFFRTPIYNEIKSSVKIHRELRFNLSAASNEVIANVPENDDFVLVQGVIDCFTENPDGTYTVIDFKTDNVKSQNATEILTDRYKNQLAFYCKAVEDITKNSVSKAIIFSFATMESVELDPRSISIQK